LIVISYSIPLFDKPEPADFTEFKKMIEEKEAFMVASEEVNSGKLFSFNPNSISETELDLLLIPVNVKKNILKIRSRLGGFTG